MSWGDEAWLSTRVIILGDNRELLSFACCLETGKRKLYRVFRFFVAFIVSFYRIVAKIAGKFIVDS